MLNNDKACFLPTVLVVEAKDDGVTWEEAGLSRWGRLFSLILSDALDKIR